MNRSEIPITPASENLGPELKKVLKPFDLIMMGVGCIIGVGIYILSGEAAANYAGPAVVISFIVAAFLCLIVGLCYGELASMFPIAGSVYSYSYHALGRATAWFLGWTLLLEYMIAASAVASGWSSYFQKFIHIFGLTLPERISSVPTVWTLEGFSVNLPSVVIVAIVCMISIIGMKESARFNNIIAVIKILVLLFFISFCAWFVKVSNWFPFIPERVSTIKENIIGGGLWDITIIDLSKSLFTGTGIKELIQHHAQFWHYGVEGILTGAAILFFTYVGFDMVSSVAEETKNPQRDIPLGIIGSLIIATVLYIAVALVLTGIIPATTPEGLPNPLLIGKDAAAPLAIAMNMVSKSQIPSLILSFGALAGVTTTLLTLNLGVTRILLAISRDRFLPSPLATIHPKFHTPYVSAILVSIITAITASLLPVGKLAALCNLGTLAAFTFVCLTVLVLRYKKPEQNRVFKCPWVPALPLLGMLFCLVLMFSLPLLTWSWFGLWFLIGLIIYVFYGRDRVTRFPVNSPCQ